MVPGPAPAPEPGLRSQDVLGTPSEQPALGERLVAQLRGRTDPGEPGKSLVAGGGLRAGPPVRPPCAPLQGASQVLWVAVWQ